MKQILLIVSMLLLLSGCSGSPDGQTCQQGPGQYYEPGSVCYNGDNGYKPVAKQESKQVAIPWNSGIDWAAAGAVAWGAVNTAVSFGSKAVSVVAPYANPALAIGYGVFGNPQRAGESYYPDPVVVLPKSNGASGSWGPATMPTFTAGVSPQEEAARRNDAGRRQQTVTAPANTAPKTNTAKPTITPTVTAQPASTGAEHPSWVAKPTTTAESPSWITTKPAQPAYTAQPVVTTPVYTQPVVTTPVVTTPIIQPQPIATTQPVVTTPVVTTPVVTTPVVTTPIITQPAVTQPYPQPYPTVTPITAPAAPLAQSQPVQQYPMLFQPQALFAPISSPPITYQKSQNLLTGEVQTSWGYSFSKLNAPNQVIVNNYYGRTVANPIYIPDYDDPVLPWQYYPITRDLSTTLFNYTDARVTDFAQERMQPNCVGPTVSEMRQAHFCMGIDAVTYIPLFMVLNSTNMTPSNFQDSAQCANAWVGNKKVWSGSLKANEKLPWGQHVNLKDTPTNIFTGSASFCPACREDRQSTVLVAMVKTAFCYNGEIWRNYVGCTDDGAAYTKHEPC